MSTSPAGAPSGELALRAAGPPDRAEVVRDAVLAVPGVAALHPGPAGAVATYLPGRRVTGVALREDGSAEVAVVAAVPRGLRTDLRGLAGRVAAAVTPLVPGPVHVVVADLQDPTTP